MAQKNRETWELLRTTDPGKFSEWIATIAFYQAVHLVEAMFAAAKTHSNSHDDRLHRLKVDKRFSQIYRHFRILYSASLVARYLAETRAGKEHQYRTFSDYLSPEEVEQQILNHHLRQIEKSVQKQMP